MYENLVNDLCGSAHSAEFMAPITTIAKGCVGADLQLAVPYANALAPKAGDMIPALPGQIHLVNSLCHRSDTTGDKCAMAKVDSNFRSAAGIGAVVGITATPLPAAELYKLVPAMAEALRLDEGSNKTVVCGALGEMLESGGGCCIGDIMSNMVAMGMMRDPTSSTGAMMTMDQFMSIPGGIVKFCPNVHFKMSCNMGGGKDAHRVVIKLKLKVPTNAKDTTLTGADFADALCADLSAKLSVSADQCSVISVGANSAGAVVATIKISAAGASEATAVSTRAGKITGDCEQAAGALKFSVSIDAATAPTAIIAAPGTNDAGVPDVVEPTAKPNAASSTARSAAVVLAGALAAVAAFFL